MDRGHRRASRNLIAVAMLALSAGIATAAAGDLDPTFDGDGKKLFGSDSVDVAQALIVQPDGKIVVVGHGNANTDIAIARLLPNGEFDGTFDGDGAVGIDLGGVDIARAAALQADGKIVVVGDNLSVPQGVILRRSADGSPDPTFGSGTFADARFQVIYGVAIQPDQKIVVAGGGTPSLNVLVARLEPNGTFDASFNLLIGYQSFDFGGVDYATAVALQPDGKIVLAGFTIPPGGMGEDVVVLRLMPDSSLDGTFDGDGMKTIDYGGFDEAHAVAVQPDGKIVVAGHGGVGRTMTVSRLEPDGSFDPTFDADGTAGVDLGDFDGAAGLALQPDGKILVAGATGGDKFAVLRLDPIGSPDPTFGDAGVVVVDFGGEDSANAIALQADGRIIAAGSASPSDLLDMAVVRLERDPSTTTTTLPAPSTDHAIPLSGVVVRAGRLVKLVAKGTFTLPDPADDPTRAGASLTLTGSGGSVSYELAAGSWKALGRRSTKAYRFKSDSCATVLVTRRTLKAVCRGGTGTLALPDPGPIDVVLTVGTGTTRYCGRCGGTARDTERVFSRRRCAAPAACP